MSARVNAEAVPGSLPSQSTHLPGRVESLFTRAIRLTVNKSRTAITGYRIFCDYSRPTRSWVAESAALVGISGARKLARGPETTLRSMTSDPSSVNSMIDSAVRMGNRTRLRGHDPMGLPSEKRSKFRMGRMMKNGHLITCGPKRRQLHSLVGRRCRFTCWHRYQK